MMLRREGKDILLPISNNIRWFRDEVANERASGKLNFFRSDLVKKCGSCQTNIADDVSMTTCELQDRCNGRYCCTSESDHLTLSLSYSPISARSAPRQCVRSLHACRHIVPPPVDTDSQSIATEIQKHTRSLGSRHYRCL